MKQPKIGQYPFLAEPFHCGFDKQLLLSHLGNYLLNAADYHSSERGYGVSCLNTINKTWVLSRLSVELEDTPKVYDKFYVETWVDGVLKFFTSRNFKIGDNSGRIFGYGRSMWAMIDTETRQPTDILAIQEGTIRNYIDTEYPCPIAKPSRGKNIELSTPTRIIDTRFSDVDMNGHVNSIKYIEHILDLWDIEWYQKHRVWRFDIAYVTEAHQGDRLQFYSTSDSSGLHSDIVITKKGDDDNDVVVCRCSIDFAYLV